MLQEIINKRNPNQNINNIIEQMINAEDLITYSTILMDGVCIICNVSATVDDEPNIKNQIIEHKFGLSHAIITCKKCSDLIKAIYLASSIERQTKTIINSFVMSQSTDADFEAKMMTIFQSPYFKSKVKVKAFCIKTEAHYNELPKYFIFRLATKSMAYCSKLKNCYATNENCGNKYFENIYIINFLMVYSFIFDFIFRPTCIETKSKFEAFSNDILLRLNFILFFFLLKIILSISISIKYIPILNQK